MLCLSVTSGCVSTSSIDENGRITVSYFGVMHILPNPEEPTVIDLRDSTLIGIFSDGVVTVGYKNNGVNRVRIGCRALIITNNDTDHTRVVEIIDSIPFSSLCKSTNEFHELNSEKQAHAPDSIQIGLTKITQSLTYPPQHQITAFATTFYGLKLGELSGIGYRENAVVSSGEYCNVLLLASERIDYEFYKNNLNFDNGDNLCIALKPNS